MIFLDANVFLRYLTPPTSPKLKGMHAVAEGLILAANKGEVDVTMSEVVLHDVVYFLSSKKHYGLPPAEIVAFLSPLLEMPGLKLPRGDKQVYRRAFDIYTTYPKLGFADSLIAARAERLGASLATFDEALGNLDIVDRWQPPRLPNN